MKNDSDGLIIWYKRLYIIYALYSFADYSMNYEYTKATQRLAHEVNLT